MDKKQQKSDKSLGEVYKLFENDPKGQDLQFLNCILDFLNRRSNFLAQPSSPNKLYQLVHSHIDAAKQSEIVNQNLNQKSTSGITSKTSKSISEKEAKEKEEKEKEKPKAKPKEKESQNKTQKIETKSEEPTTAILDESDNESDKAPAPVGNGGKTDKYEWTQSLDEVEVSLPIDANLRGKHLKIVISKKRLFIAIKGKEKTPIVDGELNESVNLDDSTWTLDREHGKDTKTLCVILAKQKGMTWWKRVIVGDPEIDTSKIAPENSKLDSLDSDTRQTVEKMMFDQRQKMKGLPTSKELEQQKILEKFKQQHPEMDFSNLKMAPDGLNKFAQ